MARNVVRFGIISIGTLAIAGCYYNKPYKIPNVGAVDFQTVKEAVGRVQYNERPADIIDERIPCHDASECGGQTDVHLKIVPSTHANYVNWKRTLSSGSSYALAKISNLENVPFGPLHLMPNETAYLVVGETTSGRRNVGLFAERNGKYEFIKEAIQLRYCNYPRPGNAAVHLHNPPQCKDEQPTGEMVQPVRLASIAALGATDLMRALIHNQALWISCSSGCCEVRFAAT